MFQTLEVARFAQVRNATDKKDTKRGGAVRPGEERNGQKIRKERKQKNSGRSKMHMTQENSTEHDKEKEKTKGSRRGRREMRSRTFADSFWGILSVRFAVP